MIDAVNSRFAARPLVDSSNDDDSKSSLDNSAAFEQQSKVESSNNNTTNQQPKRSSQRNAVVVLPSTNTNSAAATPTHRSTTSSHSLNASLEGDALLAQQLSLEEEEEAAQEVQQQQQQKQYRRSHALDKELNDLLDNSSSLVQTTNSQCTATERTTRGRKRRHTEGQDDDDLVLERAQRQSKLDERKRIVKQRLAAHMAAKREHSAARPSKFSFGRQSQQQHDMTDPVVRAKRLEVLLAETSKFTRQINRIAPSIYQPKNKKNNSSNSSGGNTATAASTNDNIKSGLESSQQQPQCDNMKDIRVPRTLTGGQLKDYQFESLRWLASLQRLGLKGSILADEMGLGKTIESIAFIAHMHALPSQHERQRPHLVIVPLNTLSAWTQAFKQWTPALRVVLHQGERKERDARMRTIAKGWIKVADREAKRDSSDEDEDELVVTSEDDDEAASASSSSSSDDEPSDISVIGSDQDEPMHSDDEAASRSKPTKKRAKTETVKAEENDSAKSSNGIKSEAPLIDVDDWLAMGDDHLKPKQEEQKPIAATAAPTGISSLAHALAAVTGKPPLAPVKASSKSDLKVEPTRSSSRRTKPTAKLASSDQSTSNTSSAASSRRSSLASSRNATAAASSHASTPRSTVSSKQSSNKSTASRTQIKAPFDVILTTFEYALRDTCLFNQIHWSTVTIDEATRIKNPAAKLVNQLLSIETDFRLLLTGTPLSNSLGELFALLRFINLQSFGRRQWGELQCWFGAQMQNSELSAAERVTVMSRLHEILRPFILRRTKEMVLTLPGRTEVVLNVPCSALQTQIYTRIQANGRLAYLQQPHRFDAEDQTPTVQVRSFNNLLMQLRKVTNHPALFSSETDDFPIDRTLIESSGKFIIIHALLHKLIAAHHRVIIFCQMTRVLDILQDYMEMLHRPCLRLDGNTRAVDRPGILAAFAAPNSEYKVMMLSTRAGGMGINAQTADTVILIDSDFNPMADAQANARVHRIGQEKEVRVMRLICSNTIEQRILDRARAKLQLNRLVIDAGQFDRNSTAMPNAAIKSATQKVQINKATGIDSSERSTLLHQILTDSISSEAELQQRSSHQFGYVLDTDQDKDKPDSNLTTQQDVIDLSDADAEMAQQYPGCGHAFNKLIARTPEEVVLFDRLDRESIERSQQFELSSAKLLQGSSRELKQLFGNSASTNGTSTPSRAVAAPIAAIVPTDDETQGANGERRTGRRRTQCKYESMQMPVEPLSVKAQQAAKPKYVHHYVSQSASLSASDAALWRQSRFKLMSQAELPAWLSMSTDELGLDAETLAQRQKQAEQEAILAELDDETLNGGQRRTRRMRAEDTNYNEDTNDDDDTSSGNNNNRSRRASRRVSQSADVAVKRQPAKASKPKRRAKNAEAAPWDEEQCVCELCESVCSNYEELQIHTLTSCPMAEV